MPNPSQVCQDGDAFANEAAAVNHGLAVVRAAGGQLRQLHLLGVWRPHSDGTSTRAAQRNHLRTVQRVRGSGVRSREAGGTRALKHDGC